MEFLSGSSFFPVVLTLSIFFLAQRLQERWKLAVLNPILLSGIAIIFLLRPLGLSNEEYQSGCQVLSYLLTPATICLAVSFYEQFQNLKAHLLAVTLGVIAGMVANIGSVWLLCQLLGLDRPLLLSLLPKSVTTAIGTVLSQEIGGIAAITTAAICITGIAGNILAPSLAKLLKLQSPIAQGVACGTASHVVGTARAAQMSQLAGAVSSLALTLAGILTCIVLSFLTQYL